MGNRKHEGRRRIALVAIVAALLCSLLGVLNASAASLSSGSIGGFEDDGNLVEEGAVTGTIDWDTVDTTSANFAKVIDDTTDTGYAGSSKENEPENFTCNSGGSSPGKNNILRAYVNTRITGPAGQNPTSAFLDLAFVRAAGNGDAHINFEFNRNAIDNPPCPYLTRADGDILLAFDFPGGGGVASVTAFSWDTGTGDWSEFTLPAGAAAGTTNSGTVPDPIQGGNIASRRFGEASVDLIAFDEATEGDLLSCPGFGHVNIRSRSSGESFNSALQDRLPQTDINLSTCGSITLKKVDQDDKPLGDAVFGLFDNANGDGDPVATCTSDIVTGLCKFTNVVPGKYWVKEISAPTGYAIDDTTTHEVNVANFENVDAGEWSDTFLQGFVQINKVLHDSKGDDVIPSDNQILIGTKFVVYQDANTNGSLDPGEESSTTDAQPAECTIQSGNSCVIGPLAAGDYRVAETVSPPGSTSAGDVDFTIVQGDAEEAVQVDYINILSDINIALDKSAEATANVGDPVLYEFKVTTTGPRLHDITLEELVDVCDADPVFVSGDTGSDEVLEVGETWLYTCTHVVLNSDGTQIDNKAKVTGTDDYGRTTSNEDTASVTVLRPDVTVTKEADDDNVAAGDVVKYTVTAHVGGDDGAIARSVTVLDDLPPNLVWSEDSADCSITSNKLTCNFGDMDKGETASVTLTATTSAANCGDLVNTAGISASNELAGATENNSSGPISIHVACLGITIDKGGPEFAHVGDTIVYDLDVTNSGKDDLTNVEVTDPVCDEGTLEQTDDGNGDATLAVGETWSYTCSHLVTANDPDPLPNKATVTGEDSEGRETTADDTHSVDILHPAIVIEKTADPVTAEPGETVTYSYKVTNTGDTPLSNVTVTDDKLGAIGTIASLAPGESQTLTRAVVIAGDSPTDNVGTATGVDPLNKSVSDTDDAHIDIVLPLVLARTGVTFDVVRWTLIGFGLMLFGLLLMSVRNPAPAMPINRMPARAIPPAQPRPVRVLRRKSL